MSFLQQGVQSALTPAGTNAAQSQNRSQRELGNMAGGFASQLGQVTGQQIDFAQRMEPARQQNLLQLTEMMKGDGLKQLGEQNKRRVAETYRSQAMQRRQQLAQSGADDATLQSFDLDLENQILQAQGDIDTEYNSPEFQAKLMAELQQYMTQGTDLSSLPALSQLISLNFGQPAAPVQQGVGGLLGQLGGLTLQANPKLLKL